MKAYTAEIPMEDVYEMYNHEWYASWWRNIFRSWLYPEFIASECVDAVVNP
jgi:hypothetical protein